MRRDVQEIFRQTPHEKQVMMFSATLSKETREICKKFMQDVNIPPYHIESDFVRNVKYSFRLPCPLNPNFRSKHGNRPNLVKCG